MKEKPISPADDFALLLETACEDFEILQAIIKQEIRMVSSNRRGVPRIQMALAKSFVANVIRAHRICEHGAQYLAIDKLERNRFLKSTPDILKVRDVNEHGYDVSWNKSKPSMHKHELEGAMLDETSMVILGPEKILMGPINLFDTYCTMAHMRELAGFAALRKEA